MSDPLAVYLLDHLAGSKLAVDLLETLRKEHADDSLGRFAAEMLVDVEEDRSALHDLVERVDAGRMAYAKEGVGWLLEKATWLKLRQGTGRRLETLESLEMLALGILGKRSLWRTLALVAHDDVRLREVDFDRLIERAETQHARVEECRLDVARTVFMAPAD